MRIGFDAKRAFCNFTGLGNYARTLIESLLQHGPPHEYFFYTPKVNKKLLWSFWKTLRGGHPNASLHLEFPESTLGKMVPALWRSLALAQKVEKHKLDLYHGLGHELPFGSSSKTPMVVTMHDLIYLRYPNLFPWVDRQFYQLKFRYACERADLIIAISEQTQRDLKDYFKVPQEKVRVCYQSCSADFKPLESFSSDQGLLQDKRICEKFGVNKDYFLYVSSLTERKNGLCLLRAYERFLDVYMEGSQLVFVGKGGPYEKMLKEYAATHIPDHEQKVKFLSHVPHEALPALYRQARASVHPSLFEGFGIPVIESLSSGTPVIVSQGHCFEEAAGPGGLYFYPYSPEASEELCQRMLTLWEKDEVRQDLRKKGLEWAQKFKPQKTAADVLKVYQELLPSLP